MAKVKGIPKPYKMFASFDELTNCAEKYFKERKKMYGYNKNEIVEAIGVRGRQLGALTTYYRMFNGDIKYCLSFLEKHFAKKFKEKSHFRYGILTDSLLKKEAQNRIQRVSEPRIKYKTYIYSDDWKKRKKVVKALYNGKCALCNRNSIMVHHRSYKNLGQPNEPQDLVPLCKECHFMFHAHFEYNKEKHSFSPRIETVRNFREYSDEVIIDKLKELS
jgi:hypothetical protein